MNLWKNPQDRVESSNMHIFSRRRQRRFFAQFPVRMAGCVLLAGFAAVLVVPAAENSPSPQDLMRKVIVGLAEHDSVAANLRFHGVVQGQNITGFGRYLHANEGDVRKLRLELTLHVDGLRTSFLQVMDGDFLWTHRLLGDAENPVIQRVDRRRLQREWRNRTVSQANELSRQPWNWMGGLMELLTRLEHAYVFEEVADGTLGDWSTLVVRGRAGESNAVLAHHSGEDPPPSWFNSEHAFDLPEELVVHVDRQDLFPYRIQYFGDSPQDNASEPRMPLLSLELADIQLDVAISANEFEYQPAYEFREITSRYLSELPSPK